MIHISESAVNLLPNKQDRITGSKGYRALAVPTR